MKTFLKDGKCYISFTDTGPGISEEILPKIFDPFFTTKPVGKGTGLGLSVNKSIVEQYNGRIFVETSSSGTTLKTILQWTLGWIIFSKTQSYDITTCEDGAKALSILDSDSFDIAIIDFKLPDVDGLTLLKHIKTISPQTGVIIITAFAQVKTAVQAIREGAFDYIAKPFTNEELLLSIEKFLKFRNLEK